MKEITIDARIVHGCIEGDAIKLSKSIPHKLAILDYETWVQIRDFIGTPVAITEHIPASNNDKATTKGEQ